jgi:hypothetical protein
MFRRHAPQVLIGVSAVKAINQVPSEAVHRVHKWSGDTHITQTNVATFGGYQFELADTEASALGAYFQQYRIAQIEIWFRPVYKANAAAAAPVFTLPLIYVAVDPNDVSSWGTLAAAQSTDNVVVNDDSETFMLKFEPSPLMAVYAGASTFTAFAHLDMPYWIDTADNTVRHYGIKWAIEGGATAFQVWQVSIRQTVEFRYGR